MKNQEHKEGFFKKAFREMGESAKAQHQVDKANFDAIKAESKATFEENRGTNTLRKAKEESKANWQDAKLSPSQRQEKMQNEMLSQIEEANTRKTVAENRYMQAKVNGGK